MWLADFFSSRRINRFYELSQRQTDILVSAATLFREYVCGNTKGLSARINDTRAKGRDVLSELETALRDSFVTPIDRQDIYNLGEMIDDMLNYINNAAREIELFSVTPTPQMQRMSVVLEAAARHIKDAVDALRKDPQTSWTCARKVERTEGLVEDEYRKAVLELFGGSDFHAILKQREVYRHLSNSADRALAVGRLIGKIVVKAT
jgi:uncharacterized protein